MNFKFMVVFKFANSDDELDTCDREFLKGNMEKKREPMVTHLNVNLKCTNMKKNITVYLAINNLDNKH